MIKQIYLVLILSFIALLSNLLIGEENTQKNLYEPITLNKSKLLNVPTQSFVSSINRYSTVNTTLKYNPNIMIMVNGMVCSFCAQGIKKSFKKNKSIEQVVVSLESKSVIIELKENKTITDSQIKKIINDAGYNVEEIFRP